MEATITKTNPLGAERVGKLMMRYAVPVYAPGRAMMHEIGGR